MCVNETAARDGAVLLCEKPRANQIKSRKRLIIYFMLSFPSDLFFFCLDVENNGTDWMRKIEVQDGDVVGVAVQQSDLPMVQFLLNGEVLHESAINRFRGTVYPSLYLPKVAITSESESESSVTVDLVLDEAKFQQMSPGPRFGPVIVARSIC